MAFNLADPPEWWVKYKPLRWIFGLVVLLFLYTTVLPRFRGSEPPAAPAPVAQSDIPAFPDDAAPKPAPTPAPTPVAKAEPAPIPPAPVVKPTAPPAPVVKPTPPPAPVVTPAPPPVAKPAPAPAPAAKPAAPAPVAQPAAPPVVAKAEPPAAAKPAPVDPVKRYTTVEAERVNFIGKLRSYESVEKLQAQLRAAGYSAEQSTIEKKVPRDRYPPFRNDTLLVPNYKHGEHEGKLTLEFFNDRLYQAQFIPKQPREYLQWLRKNDVPLARRSSGRSSFAQGHLQVVSNIDFATSEVGSSMSSAPFVMWEDTRLVQQMREWGPLPR